MFNRRGLQSLRRHYVAARKEGKLHLWESELREGFESGEIKPQDFSIRALFEYFIENADGTPCGYEIVCDWNPSQGGSTINLARLLESNAVDDGAFSNITGQIVYSRVLEMYQAEAFVFQSMIPTVNTPYSGEKIAGIGGLNDLAQVIQPGGEYPRVGLNEDWIRTPETLKRGSILELYKETVYFDRTGQILQQAGKLGDTLGINREKRAIDCVIDENTTAHRYNRKDLGAMATYGNSSGTHDFDNLEASNALVDWTDVDNADQLLFSIVDPNTGEPITLSMAPKLICARQLQMTALRIRNATEITVVTPGYATSANPIETRGANPVSGKFEVVTSAQLAARLGTDTSWFYGDPSKAFAYMENWPLATIQAPPNSQEEFTRDVAYAWKASERGSYVTVDPRYMVKCTA